MLQRIYLALEHVVMTYLVPRDRPGPVWRVIFKQPIRLYKLGLGWLIGKRVLLLHTTGRKTGRHRITPLEYRHDPAVDVYTVMTGWGGKTDWYRNACANPSVYVQVGRREFHAVARPVSRKEVAHMLAEVIRLNPRALRMLARWSDEPVDGALDSLYRLAVHYPSLTLHPVDSAAGRDEEVDFRDRHNRTGADNGDAHLKRQMMGREVVVAVTGALGFWSVGADLLRRIRRWVAQTRAGEDHRRVRCVSPWLIFARAAGTILAVRPEERRRSLPGPSH